MSNGQNLMEDRDFLVRLFGDENDGVENAAPSRLRAASARPLRKPLAPISANVGAAHQPPSAAGKTNGRLQSASTYLNKTAHNKALPPGEAVPGRRLASASTYLISSHVPIAAAAAPPPPTTNPAQQLPKINRFKAKHAELFDALEAPKGEPRRVYTGAKTKPPTAWGTLENGQSLAGGDGSSHAPAAVASQLRGTQESLAHAHATVARDMQRAQRQLLKDGNLAVLGLPLAYLYGKPELRRYALEHVAHRLRRLAVARAHDALVHAFRTWRTPPAVRCDDRQVGLLVLAQAFQQMLDRATARAFRHWAIFYASRHNALRASVMDEAARDIQRWYRWQKQRTRDSYQRLVNALSVAVQRRRAIKYTVQMEIWARKAQLKIVRGIVHRRRRHLAARSIQRVYRWTVLYRRVMWKIIRLRAAIRIQRFWRMELARPRMDHAIFLAIARAGGYTKVTKKVPARFTAVAERGQGQGQGQRRSPPASPVRRTRLGVELPPGLLAGINACVVLIQRAWMRYAGRGAVFAELQARREQEALEMLRNDAAGVIQNSYRAHLWDRLMEAAVLHNRARRIQRAARAHQWRAAVHAFVTKRRAVRRTRARAVRERFLRRALLWAKFSLRRQALLQMELARNEATTVVARAFRRYSARVLQAQLDAVRRRAELRNSVEGLVAVVSLVQRNWRQTRETHAARLEKHLTTNLFPRHVRLVMAALQRRERLRLHHAALAIQRLVRAFLQYVVERNIAVRVRALRALRRIFRVGLLRLVLHRRVVATRARKHMLANRLKRWWRKVLFRSYVRVRVYWQRARHEQARFVHATASRIQRFLHQKRLEYFSAGRVAARVQIQRRLEREEAARVWARRDAAARTVQKALRGHRRWCRALRRYDVERVYYRRHNAAVALQKFFKMVIAWTRFWDAADARQARKEAEEQRRKYHAASNVIGFYWRRWREKRVLRTLFTLRRQMLDEYYRLSVARVDADVARKEALDEVQRSEETMMATVASAWRQGSDPYGRNYFYNYITGESSWKAPETWKVKPGDLWVRNKDDRDNVFYFNMQTGESRWLPPCCVCGNGSDRHCGDCGAAFCVAHFEEEHASAAKQNHEWNSVETEKEPLRAGEAHCCECKKRIAKVMCTTCWDPYCADCFKYVHRGGALKAHVPMNYRKAKAGWMCIKAAVPGEQDYYVHGQTGETTYEKPFELMTAYEKTLFQNFKAHQAANDEAIAKVEKLQVDLEAASYERDTILFDAINGTGKVGQLLKNRQKQANKDRLKVVASVGPVKPVYKSTFLGRLLGDTREKDEYQNAILATSSRERGKVRDKYVQEVIDAAVGFSKEEKT